MIGRVLMFLTVVSVGTASLLQKDPTNPYRARSNATVIDLTNLFKWPLTLTGKGYSYQWHPAGMTCKRPDSPSTIGPKNGVAICQSIGSMPLADAGEVAPALWFGQYNALLENDMAWTIMYPATQAGLRVTFVDFVVNKSIETPIVTQVDEEYPRPGCPYPMCGGEGQYRFKVTGKCIGQCTSECRC